MLLRMLPEQVSSQWETIWASMECVMAEQARTEKGKSNVLSAMLAGEMQCWLLKDDEDDEVLALASTCFFYDPSGRKSLFIYTLLGYKPVSIKLWTEAFETLSKWAGFRGCDSVMAHTQNAKIIRLVNHLGGKAEDTLVYLDVIDMEKEV